MDLLQPLSKRSSLILILYSVLMSSGKYNFFGLADIDSI
jgi:hypothetical protein